MSPANENPIERARPSVGVFTWLAAGTKNPILTAGMGQEGPVYRYPVSNPGQENADGDQMVRPVFRYSCSVSPESHHQRYWILPSASGTGPPSEQPRKGTQIAGQTTMRVISHSMT